MTRAWSKPASLWLVAATVALFAGAWSQMDTLGDTFWYIATGRYVLEHRGFPTDELFSYTGVRGPWMVNMPISEPLFAWVTDHLGLHALLLFCTLVYGVALTLCWLPHARSPFARVVTWPLVLFAIYAERQDLSARSQTLAYLFLAVLFICLFRFRDGRRVPPWLPFAMGALWVNIHPSFLLGVFIPLGYALALRIGRAEREPSLDTQPRLRPVLWFSALLMLGGFVNPYGHKLVFEFVRFMNAESTTAIDLFRSPNFWLPEVLLALSIGAGLIYQLLRAPSTRGGAPEAMLMLALIAVTIVGRRYLSILVLYQVVIAGRLLDGDAWVRKVPRGLAWAPLFVLPAALVVFSLRTPKDPFRNMPVEAVRYIDDHQLPDNVLNMLHWGGYLDFVWNGRRKVFIDGRTTQFENGVIGDHAKLLGLTRGAPDVLDAYFINTVLWESGSALDRALATDAAWTLAFRQGFAVVYVRKDPVKP